MPEEKFAVGLHPIDVSNLRAYAMNPLIALFLHDRFYHFEPLPALPNAPA